MAWDADGTIFGQYGYPYGVWTDRTANAAELNDEDDVVQDIRPTGSDYGYGAWVFPELRDLKGVFYAVNNGAGPTTGGSAVDYYYYSVDTTNGLDGTWVLLDGLYPDGVYAGTLATSNYRIGIASYNVTGIRGFRYLGSHSAVGANRYRKAMHLYGTISAGETPDRLLFIDNSTGLEFTEVLDWGDVPRGTTLDYDIKIKNNSSTLTANTNVLDFESLYLGADVWYTIKETGGSFGSTLNIASIAPGATYPAGGNVITIRLAVPDSGFLSFNTVRLKLTTGSWT